MSGDYLSFKEAAYLLKVPEATLHALVRQGRIKAESLPDGKGRALTRAEFNRVQSLA